MRGGHSGSGQTRTRPGSEGERRLQQQLGTTGRAERFYDEQVLDHLNERMWEFTERQEMFFLATSDQHGECDNSFRAGPAGFLRVLDSRTLVFPEYRGNGVHASLGNIGENPHLGILMVDFVRARIGLHVNGSAQVVEDEEMRTRQPDLPVDPIPGRRAQLWVLVSVEEAYIHCAKHIPHFQKAPKRSTRDWGTDDYKRKGGDFFGAARDAREQGPAEHPYGEQTPAASAPAASAPAASAPVTSEPASPESGGAKSESAVLPAEPGVPWPRDVPKPRTPAPEAEGGDPTDRGAVPGAGLERAPERRSEPVYGGRADAGGAADPGHQTDTDWATMALSTVAPAQRSGSGGAAVTDAESVSSRARESGRPVEPSWPAAATPSAPREPVPDVTGRRADFDQEQWRQEAERALAEAERRARENAGQEAIPFQGWFS